MDELLPSVESVVVTDPQRDWMGALRRVYDAVSAARSDIADYLDWYNAHRPHSSVERLTPAEKYVAELSTMKLAA